MNKSVLQKWIQSLTLKQQTVLIEVIRGPDFANLLNLKRLIRWIRSIVLNNADPGRSFMKGYTPPKSDLKKEFDFCTVHLASHLLYSLEVIAYKHPDPKVSDIAMDYYTYFVESILHCRIEEEEPFDFRLRDKIQEEI